MSDMKSTISVRGDGQHVVVTGPTTCCFGAELPIKERPDDQRWYSIEMRHWREAAQIAGDKAQ